MIQITPTQRIALDFYSSGMNLDEYCLLQEYAFSAATVAGPLQGEVKNILIDAIQVGLGAGAVTLTGGMGGDTAVDVLFAVNASNEVKNSVESIASSGDVLSQVVSDISSLNTAQGMDGIYATIQKSVNAIISGIGVEQTIIQALDTAREGVIDFLNTIINAVAKWIATLIPDDAGLSGTLIRQIVNKAIKSAALTPYDVLESGVSSLPASAQSIVLDPDSLSEFLTTTLDSIVEYLKTRTDKGFIDRTTDWLPYIGAGKEAIKGNWKAAAVKGTASVVAPVSMPSMGMYVELAAEFDTIIDFLDNTVRSKIPLAIEIFNKIIALLFGCVALLQIILSGDYQGSRPIDADVEDESMADLLSKAGKEVSDSDILASISLEESRIRISEIRIKQIIREELQREIVMAGRRYAKS